MEKISSTLKLEKLKKEGVKRSMQQWMNALQEYENSIDSTQVSMEECFTDLQFREKNVAYVHECAIKRNEQVNILKQSVEERLDYVRNEGKKFKLMVERYVDELNAKEEKLVKQHLRVEGLFRKVESVRVCVGEKLKEIEVREVCVESRARDVEERERQLDDRVKELELSRNSMEERATLLEIMEKELDDWKVRTEKKEGEMEVRKMQIKDHRAEIYAYQDQMKEFSRLFKVKVEKLAEREKIIGEKEKEMELMKNVSEERLRELEEKERLLDSVQKLVREPKEKQLEKRYEQLIQCNEGQLEADRDNAKVRGQKHTIPSSSGRNIKRTATGEGVGEPLRECGQILEKLMKHKYGWVFNKPVDAVALGIPDYHAIIKHPMDLGTVKSRLHEHKYGSPHEFASDVRLTFNNALLYNPKTTDVNKMASALLELFEEKFNV